MKKTYMKPEMEVEVMELENMLAGSDPELTFAGKAADRSSSAMDGKDRNDGDWGGLW